MISFFFRVIQKIAFASLCKTYIDIIIQIFYFHFEWKNKKKRKHYKNL